MQKDLTADFSSYPEPLPEYDYSVLGKSKEKRLRELTEQIYSTYKQTLTNVITLGAYFTEAKKMLDRGEFMKWVSLEFSQGPLNFRHASVQNWMNVHRMYETKPEFREAMQQIDLWILYKVCTSKVDPKIRDSVFELAQEGVKLTAQDFEAMKRVTKGYNLSQSGLTSKVREKLTSSELAERPEELQRLSTFSQKKQLGIAEILSTGEASTVKEALSVLLNSANSPHQTITVHSEEGSSTLEDLPPPSESDFELYLQHFSGRWDTALRKIDPGTVNLLIAECPLKYAWVKSERGLNLLSKIAHEILAPGGMMIATSGHKAVMSTESELAPLEPLHVLTLRRMPGHTRSIVGINIAAASILMTLSYKPPFRAPEKMLVDLQTIEDATLPGLDEIPNGIESGFDQIIQSLVRPGDIVTHALCGEEHFKIRDSLKTSALDAGAYGWLTVG